MTERWNLVELSELCTKHGLADPTIFTDSFERRQNRAKYHAKTAQEGWSDFFEQPFNAQYFSVSDPNFQEAVFIYEANTEACIQALHSLGDILAQIINVTVLPKQKQLSEKEVSLYSIYKRMKNVQPTTIAPDVVYEIHKLDTSDTYQYINAFCNMIKHRRLLSTDFRIENKMYHDEGKLRFYHKAGLRFQSFSYGRTESTIITYPITWGSDILDKYLVDVIEKCNNVGLKINEYLR